MSEQNEMVSVSVETLTTLAQLLNQVSLNVGSPDFIEASKALVSAKEELNKIFST